MIAPIAIERIMVESTMNSPASEIDHRDPGEGDRGPEIRRATRAASAGWAPGPDLLAVARENEQRSSTTTPMPIIDATFVRKPTCRSAAKEARSPRR